jgi:hypothetical protein
MLCSVALLWGCASANAKTARPFADGKQLSTLERGVSTRRDVQRLLGAPDGSGHVLLPTEDTQLDLWYYADIEMKDLRQVTGGFRGDVRQQVLLVAFRGDVFDGFMWWSNAGSLK